MARVQQVAWFTDPKDADAFEAKLYAQALSNGQKCDKWADIIEDKVIGFGVPVKDRVLPAVSASEQAKVVDWTPPLIAKVSAEAIGTDGLLPV